MPLILGTNSIKDTGYNVANSARFDDGSSDNLQRTYGTPTNNKIFGLSWWFKLGKAYDGSGSQDFWGERAGSGDRVFMGINADGTFEYFEKDGSSTTLNIKTNRLFRDNSAWFHFLLLGDSTQGTASNRLKLYINGVQETSLATESYPAEDYQFRLAIGSSTKYFGRIGLGGGLSTNYYDGYLCEAVFVDGTVTAHTDYGEFDSDTPTIWKPKNVSGLTFGNNGFYLDFEDSSALGNDVSGNDNDFTVNNLTAVDQSTDTCTNNFATFNALLNYSSTMSLAEGNLKGTTGSSHEAFYQSFFSSIGVSAGKWYAEFKVTAQSNHSLIGISADLESDANGSDGSAYSFIYKGQGIGYYGSNGKFFHTDSNTQVTYGSALSNNDIVGVAMDVDNQEVYFSINGTFQNSGDPTSGSSKTGGCIGDEGARNIFSTGTGTLFFAVADFDQSAQCVFEANFGGGSVSAISSGNSDANGFGNFEYSVPSGYFSLCTKNLAEFG